MYQKILVVDDSHTSRMIIQRCIQMAGSGEAEFLFAENGIEALSVLEDNSGIQLIITDINMPKMDGETFIRLVKSRDTTNRIPVVITSSIADGSIEEEMTRLGVKAIIKKPVSPEKIALAFGEAT